VVGAAACLAYLNADEVVASPLPVGRGFVRAEHGHLPLPAPATVACLTGVPTYSVDLETELVTPTGAAIIATVAKRFERWPNIRPEASGYGAGTQELPDRPNVLRLVLGAHDKEHHHDKRAHTHVVLEANVDDLTGELAAHAMAALLEAGALDAWATPIVMKKGRPALVLSALADNAHADAVAQVLLAETTTLGLRRTEVTRNELDRKTIEVDTRFGRLPMKVSAGKAKPEFDASAKAARKHGVPVRIVIQAALAAYPLSTGNDSASQARKPPSRKGTPI
jgi:uncharacterized protein (TIGR00299 family) protein